MRFIIKPVFIFFYSFLLLGCDAIIPANKEVKVEPGMFGKSKTENYVIFSPMEGVLLKNGKPLPNTKIIRLLKWNGNEDGLVEEFSTDELGRFSLPVHEEELALGMLSQFVGNTELNVTIDGETVLIWYNSKLLPEKFSETGGPIDELTCDLDFEEIPIYINDSIVPNIMSRCRWKNMPIS